MDDIEKVHVSSGVEVDRSAMAWTPANKTDASAQEISASATPPDANASQQNLSSIKRRREERERTRVSRACDRCKKYVIS
jgi:hypothetical protein